ncbi:MAG: hypothetical protein AAGF85_17990, partial [Bacteroidota bacterium]
YTYSQVEKKWQLGISTGISETSKEKIRNWVISPKASYQLSKRFILSSEGHYFKDVFTRSDNEGEVVAENVIDGSFLLGLGARYNAIISEKCGILFIGSSLNYDFMTNETILFLTPGIYYQLKGVILDLSFDISTDRIFQNNVFISTELGINIRI